MTDLIFDTPWWLPTLLGIIGIVLFITGNNRQEFRIRTAGLIVIALAILLIVVSFLVQTDREKAEAGSRRLIQAVSDRDWTTLQNTLDPKASVAVLDARTVANNRDQIIALAKRGVDEYGLKSIRITSLDSRQDQSLITVTTECLTEQSSFPYPMMSTWQFDWIKNKDGLHIYRITCLKVGNETGQRAESHFPSP